MLIQGTGSSTYFLKWIVPTFATLIIVKYFPLKKISQKCIDNLRWWYIDIRMLCLNLVLPAIVSHLQQTRDCQISARLFISTC